MSKREESEEKIKEKQKKNERLRKRRKKKKEKNIRRYIGTKTKLNHSVSINQDA